MLCHSFPSLAGTDKLDIRSMCGAFAMHLVAMVAIAIAAVPGALNKRKDSARTMEPNVHRTGQRCNSASDAASATPTTNGVSAVELRHILGEVVDGIQRANKDISSRLADIERANASIERVNAEITARMYTIIERRAIPAMSGGGWGPGTGET